MMCCVVSIARVITSSILSLSASASFGGWVWISRCWLLLFLVIVCRYCLLFLRAGGALRSRSRSGANFALTLTAMVMSVESLSVGAMGRGLVTAPSMYSLSPILSGVTCDGMAMDALMASNSGPLLNQDTKPKNNSVA